MAAAACTKFSMRASGSRLVTAYKTTGLVAFLFLFSFFLSNPSKVQAVIVFRPVSPPGPSFFNLFPNVTFVHTLVLLYFGAVTWKNP